MLCYDLLTLEVGGHLTQFSFIQSSIAVYVVLGEHRLDLGFSVATPTTTIATQ